MPFVPNCNWVFILISMMMKVWYVSCYRGAISRCSCFCSGTIFAIGVPCHDIALWVMLRRCQFTVVEAACVSYVVCCDPCACCLGLKLKIILAFVSSVNMGAQLHKWIMADTFTVWVIPVIWTHCSVYIILFLLARCAPVDYGLMFFDTFMSSGTKADAGEW